MGTQRQIDALLEKGKSEREHLGKSGFQYVFETLYRFGNSVTAIHSALALVASHYSFERGYIFETSADGKTTSNTFEWCAPGVPAEKENLQNVPVELGSTANRSFLETGIFVLKSLDDLPDLERKVLEPQGIQSMVQFGILDKGKMLGFMGFDNCRGNALRNNEEIGEISAICNILATFFIKQRADDVTVKEAQLQVEVMNRLNNYIFVVDAHTYEVLFMNHKTMQFIGERECHMPCYQFFRQHRYPCTDCPIKALKEAGEAQATREIYNEYLEMWVKISASTLRWKDERQVYLLECADITKQREEHLRHIDQLEQLAFVDELTGSRSFYKFKKDAQQILQDKEDTRYFLVKLDIDNFKLVNQLYGYEKGDEILCCVAEAIQKTTRNEEEIFARISSDEFVALFAMGDGIINRELHHKFLDIFYGLLDPGIVFQFTFSYGIYVITRADVKELDIKELFEKVNLAHKTAKADKSQKIVVYNEKMIEKALHAKEIENKMGAAMQNNEFVVFLQPKYDLETEKISGAEALTRWKNENAALFLPGAFIPIFEQNGFVTKLDFYVLHHVCRTIKDWLEKDIQPVAVSVNFSRLHLNNASFVKELCQVVDYVGIDRKYIEIEITETAIYDNIDRLRILLDDLHVSGFTMSMDDFGSGYSSLGMLKDLPVDIIKMDRSFFVNQKDARRSKVVLGSVISMAEALGIRTVAEGVEEQQHIDLLHELHCDMVQGFYYAKPMPTQNFTNLLLEQRTELPLS